MCLLHNSVFMLNGGYLKDRLLWPSGISSRLGRNRLRVRFLAVSDIYPMFIEPTITWVPLGFSWYIWLDTKILFFIKNGYARPRDHVSWYEAAIMEGIFINLMLLVFVG